ncbi:MAG: DUF4982 domain-containing protein [Treponema sp.]|jgi:hypothetical protein|nr:DUF4982 domain-containing protein [Treponema sp.]
MEILYLQDWQFSLSSHQDPWRRDFDDNAWQSVVVPHDWAVSQPFSPQNSSGTGYLPGGTGWYRTRFVLPKAVAQKLVFLNFDGVYKHSKVWCNGYYLGGRASGYSRSRYALSHCLHADKENVIAVQVSHEDIADSRWYTGSGIFRKVTVQIHDPVYIPQDSIVITSELGDNNTAALLITGDALNTRSDDAHNVEIRLNVSLSEAAQQTISIGTLAPSASKPFAIRVTIPAPHVWSPDTPFLYTVRLELSASNAHYVSPPIRAGIRSIRFDADKGFFLNGKALKLKGVCAHDDAGCLGAAVWADVWRRRLEKLKAMGCNAIRASHNPHTPALYELCDELGFLVMEESFDEWEGCKNKWFHGHNVYPPVHQGYYEDFPEWHERDLADMVIRGRNHPSIIAWSVGNEIDYPNDPYCHPLFMEMLGNNDKNKPKKEMLYSENKPNMERLTTVAAELVRIVKRYDSTRPVLAAAAFPELSSQIGFFDSFDIIGYNYKEQFYEADHQRFPHLPILGSENNHSLQAWKAVTDHEYISGQFLWTGIDFLGEAYGWPIRGSLAGLLDLAGNEKAEYYRRKTLWQDAPQVYLVTGYAQEGLRPEWGVGLFRSWNYQPNAEVTVVCYTNLDEAELFCNGKSYACQKRPADREYLLWKIPFTRGSLRVVGSTPNGDIVSDTLESTLPATRLHLRQWRPAQAPIADYDDGKYRIAQIELELLDEQNRICVMETPIVTVSLTGAGILLGMENGNLADCDAYSAPRRRVFHGRLVIYALTERGNPEPLTLTATSEGFLPVNIEIHHGGHRVTRRERDW